MRILIGYKGCEPSKAALHDLRHAGLPEKTEILVMTVAESWPGSGDLSAAEAIAAEGAELVRRDFPACTVLSETAPGSPPREILARAESFHPDLIIVGEPRYSVRQNNVLIGNTSHTLLTEAKCSVRIARGNLNEASHTERIVVGFDGSAGSIRAVESVAERKWETGTCVRLLSVADSSVLDSIGRFTPQMTNASVQTKFASQWAESLAASSKENLSKAGICASVELKLGHAKDVIIKEAEDWDADTIFVGPHSSANSFERFLIGSVSAAVAARAHCSVEVVRDPN